MKKTYKSNPAKTHSSREMPLAHLKPGSHAKVSGACHCHGQIHRLASMGLTPGAELTMIMGGPRGPVIVEVHSTRYIIGRGMAQDIMVEPLKCPAAQP